MNEYVKVNIEWLTKKEHLEQIPEDGIRFCTQIKFDEEGEKIPQWTAEIIITKCIGQYLYSGNLRYLFEQAPKYLLKSGKKFTIFDGPFLVAKGEVLTDFK